MTKQANQNQGSNADGANAETAAAAEAEEATRAAAAQAETDARAAAAAAAAAKPAATPAAPAAPKLEKGKAYRFRAVFGEIVHPWIKPEVRIDTDSSIKLEADDWLIMQFDAGKLALAD